MPKNLTDQSNTFFAPDRAAWRAWLAEHSSREGEADSEVSEVWLIFTKSHTGQPCIDYEAAVEEALCFGWIDSLIQRIDDQRYARKFNVRKDYATWSESNRRRLRKLAHEGRLPADLLARIPAEVFDESVPGPRRPDRSMPDWLEGVLRANPAAWATYQRLAPSHQRTYLGWIMSAKRQETRERRAAEAVRRLEQGLELGLK
jgi:uncharacterized protein YdeI (YjbR/CyaY-like superfamily)